MFDLRAIQGPLKLRYRQSPQDAVIRSTAHCSMKTAEDPREALLEAGPLRLRVGAHPGVGGTGAEPCSGDLLVSALAACQQITLQMVAAAMGIDLAACEVTVDGELDLRGTLGTDPEAAVGYRDLTCAIRLSAPTASPAQLEKLLELARRFCVVHATLSQPPRIEVRIDP